MRIYRLPRSVKRKPMYGKVDVEVNRIADANYNLFIEAKDSKGNRLDNYTITIIRYGVKMTTLAKGAKCFDEEIGEATIMVTKSGYKPLRFPVILNKYITNLTFNMVKR